MYCSVANLVTYDPHLTGNTTLFFYILGGAELLVLLGSRMLFRLKEMKDRPREGSFIVPEETPNPVFRSYTVTSLEIGSDMRYVSSFHSKNSSLRFV